MSLVWLATVAPTSCGVELYTVEVMNVDYPNGPHVFANSTGPSTNGMLSVCLLSMHQSTQRQIFF